MGKEGVNDNLNEEPVVINEDESSDSSSDSSAPAKKKNKKKSKKRAKKSSDNADEIDMVPIGVMLLVIILGGGYLLMDTGVQQPTQIIQQVVIQQDGSVVSAEPSSTDPSSDSQDSLVSSSSEEPDLKESVGKLVTTAGVAAAGAAAAATATASGLVDKITNKVTEVKKQVVEAVKPTLAAPTLSADINKWFSFLLSAETFVVEQKRRGQECIEACTGCTFANQYFVKQESYSRQKDGEVNNDGDWEDKHPDTVMLTAVEDSNCCMRQICGRLATFTLDIFPQFYKKDVTEATPILKIERPFSCTDAAGVIPFFNACGFGQEMKILDPMNGKLIGRVKEVCGTTCWKGTWQVYRSDKGKEELVATVNSPIFPQAYMCCCEDVDFPIKRKDTEEEIGKISRRWGDWCTSICTTYDDMSITINDRNVDLVERILLMSTALLFKYVYFEGSITDPIDNACCLADAACCLCGPDGVVSDCDEASEACCCLLECLCN